MPLQYSDAPTIAELANDFEVARRLVNLPHPYGPEDAHDFLRDVAPRHATWKVTRSTDGAMMGIVGLRPVAETVHNLGYWFGRRFWGQGHATEAGRAVVAHAWAIGSVTRLVSGYFAENEASGRVLRKLGFVEHGRSMQRCEALDRDLDYIDVELLHDAAGS